MKIKVCTVHYCGLSKETRASVDSLRGKFDYFHVMAESTYIAEGRNTTILSGKNSLLRPALEPEYTHYLMLDSDIGFTPEQLQMLIDADLPIVSGLYQSRCNDNAVAGHFVVTDGNIDGGLSMDSTGIVNVDWCGAGFMLIKRNVLESMDFPWFHHSFVEYDENGIKHRIQTGEDVSFCIAAKKAGFDIHVHCDCKVQHIINKAQAYSKGGRTMPAKNDGVSFEQFSAFLMGKVDVAKGAIDAVVDDCMKNIKRLVEENDKLKEEINGLKEAAAKTIEPAKE